MGGIEGGRYRGWEVLNRVRGVKVSFYANILWNILVTYLDRHYTCSIVC